MFFFSISPHSQLLFFGWLTHHHFKGCFLDIDIYFSRSAKNRKNNCFSSVGKLGGVFRGFLGVEQNGLFEDVCFWMWHIIGTLC